MIADPNKVWIGVEYFCNENDKLWNMNDEDFKDAIIKIFDSEAHKIYLQLVQYYQLDALR